MAIISNRQKNKNIITRFLRFIKKNFKKNLKITAFAIIIIYVSYNIYNYFKPEQVLEYSGVISEKADSISSFIHKKIDSFKQSRLTSKEIMLENQRLKSEILDLKSSLQKFDLIQKDNIELMELLNFMQDVDTSFITTPIYTYFDGRFFHDAIIKLGKNNDIKINATIFTNIGFVGRVIDTSQRYSKIMLASNISSRIPVINKDGKIRGIVAGYGNIEKAKLIYLSKDVNIEEGEALFTSSDGCIHPRGILVGFVEKSDNGEILVRLAVRLRDTHFILVHNNVNDDIFSSDQIFKKYQPVMPSISRTH